MKGQPYCGIIRCVAKYRYEPIVGCIHNILLNRDKEGVSVTRKRIIAVVSVVLLCGVIIVMTLNLRGQDESDSLTESPDADAVESTAKSVTEGTQKKGNTEKSTGAGSVAVSDASKADRYLFVFFYRENNEKVRQAKADFVVAMSSVSGRADSISVDVTDPDEKGIVDKYRLGRTPMPLVLVMAPNGAITGAFPGQFDGKQFSESIISPCAEECLKALQERRLVFLCFQNDKTAQNDAAMRGVTEFAADARFSQATEIIKIDPAIKSELEFLNKMKIEYKADEALTVFIVPPGQIIGTYRGATDKAVMEKTLLAAVASCGTGCAPSGCGPKK